MQSKQFDMAELYAVILEVIESGGEFRLFPRGTSMRPLLREGKDSVLLVSPKALKKHDICLYRRASGSFVLHRLIKLTKQGDPIFCGDNQTALEHGVPREAIIARVGAFYRGDRRVSLTSLSYRLYVFFYVVLRMRYLRLLPYRIKARLCKRK